MAFGRFRVLVHQRELLADNLPVKLGGRAFDVLMALIKARGTVVSKEPLIQRVWPDRLAGICRRLDGIPLEIELAAARAAALGIDRLAAGLDDRFRLLTRGRRTALPRHQILRGALDWSNELPTEPERVGLRRLPILAGGFTLWAAREVVADDKITATDVINCVASLTAKSLVTADVGGAMPRYRLLETTRAYALEKLVHLERVLAHHVAPSARWQIVRFS
jgi:predicted ATPase